MKTHCKEEPRNILFESHDDKQIKTLLREMDDFIFKLEIFKEKLERHADREDEETISLQARESFHEAARATRQHLEEAKRNRHQPL